MGVLYYSNTYLRLGRQETASLGAVEPSISHEAATSSHQLDKYGQAGLRFYLIQNLMTLIRSSTPQK